jgi:hypothetical protein
MPVLNPFDLSSQGFSLAETVEAINLLPNRYSRINELGIFSDISLSQRVAIIEIKNNSLTILPTTPWGAPGPTSGGTSRRIQSLVVPHTSWEDTVLAADVMGVRAFGTDSTLETIQQKVLEKFQLAKDLFDITDEYRKICALKGIVLDADGTTALFNSYTSFGITKKTITFKFSDTAANIPDRVLDIRRYMEDNLLGETMQSIHVFVGPDFYRQLINHPSVKSIWQNWAGAPMRLATDLRRGFELEGIVFEEYRGIVPKPDGGTPIKFLDDDKGVAIPIGTSSTFKRFLAPADYVDTVNTIAKPYYALQRPMDDGRGIRLFAQSNSLPICTRPGLLVEVKTV